MENGIKGRRLYLDRPIVERWVGIVFTFDATHSHKFSYRLRRSWQRINERLEFFFQRRSSLTTMKTEMPVQSSIRNKSCSLTTHFYPSDVPPREAYKGKCFRNETGQTKNGTKSSQKLGFVSVALLSLLLYKEGCCCILMT